MSILCMQRRFPKEISLFTSGFILWYVLLDSWNKNHLNMDRRKCLTIMIKLYSHLVILVLFFIFFSRNRILGKMDLSHGQYGHGYKQTCTKFSLPSSSLNTKREVVLGKEDKVSITLMQVSKLFL